MYGGNNGTPMFPIFVDENQLQYDSNASTTQLQLFGSIPAVCNPDPTNFLGNNNIASLNLANKRSRESEDAAMQHKLQISLNNFYQDAADRSANIPNPNAVSTGLRLSYDDDEHNSSVTTASGSMSSLPAMPLGDMLRTEMDRQKEEFDQYIRVQEAQFAKGVKELKQRHIASFMTAIDKGVNRKLREKEVEIETMNRKNRELADRIKQAANEAQNWQYRARYNESMVHALQNNLKQALAAQGAAAAAAAADQGKEGCGESEVDDAASSFDPNNTGQPSQQQSASVGACRVCMRKEVCMLLLPCRHLCMCRDCDGLVDACPVCVSPKTASVEVYMS